ncbi:hypothetical protein L1987_06485 [Smallanthus sonchifolius]|uniref:Uncharacterized protein n=1 Tax=Smallanthus sonchifolius TaxID=185202 RepID=A0ACB9JYF8_9ASTR|nr:hypothetical protein L1987_06485 [Smallanthus sonchifolius]
MMPSKDLDSLISVTTDEDLENMIEEYARLGFSNASSVNLFDLDDEIFLPEKEVVNRKDIIGIADLGGGGGRECCSNDGNE